MGLQAFFEDRNRREGELLSPLRYAQAELAFDCREDDRSLAKGRLLH